MLEIFSISFLLKEQITSSKLLWIYTVFVKKGGSPLTGRSGILLEKEKW